MKPMEPVEPMEPTCKGLVSLALRAANLPGSVARVMSSRAVSISPHMQDMQDM